MHSPLPDVASNEKPAVHGALDWVGMKGIDLPIRLTDNARMGWVLAARADIQVDLPTPDIKGIHMSRLHRLLNASTECAALTPSLMDRMLVDAVNSHADCGTTRSRVAIAFPLLLRRPALVTPGLHGWKSYPVVIEGHCVNGEIELRLSVSVLYSSTCPCSAALARQIVASAFDAAFAEREKLSKAELRDWLARNATAATPHSQRSEARVCVLVSPYATSFDLEGLVTAIESALSTPVQTAVKRADEQEFARLNGQNLMYVEDASRKIMNRLAAHYENVSVRVNHMESLHPHDATAEVSSFGAAINPHIAANAIQ